MHLAKEVQSTNQRVLGQVTERHIAAHGQASSKYTTHVCYLDAIGVKLCLRLCEWVND